MDGMKHTPGTWVVDSSTEYRLIICAPWSEKVKAGEASGMGDYRGIHVAYIDHQYENPCVALLQATANAHLIAAAPNLLAYAECSAALDCARCDPRYDPHAVLFRHGWNVEEDPSVFLSRIRRDAITKAVGHYLGKPEGRAA